MTQDADHTERSPMPSYSAGQTLRDSHADIRRITFTGNRSLCRDTGATLRVPQQHWSQVSRTPVLFEGLFCIPVLNVDLRIAEPMNVPARMRLTGHADNGMVFSREFTFPAGRTHREIAGIESDRPTGGVFDLATRIAWRLESDDAQTLLEGGQETIHNIYFVPRWDAMAPPFESVLHVTCQALRGLGPGQRSAIDRLWQAIESLDIPAANGKSRLVCGRPARRHEHAKDLLRTGHGGAAAWLDFFRACVALANSRSDAATRSESGEWPWTVDSFSLKSRLLESKCQHMLREKGLA